MGVWFGLGNLDLSLIHHIYIRSVLCSIERGGPSLMNARCTFLHPNDDGSTQLKTSGVPRLKADILPTNYGSWSSWIERKIICKNVSHDETHITTYLFACRFRRTDKLRFFSHLLLVWCLNFHRHLYLFSFFFPKIIKNTDAMSL